MLKKTIALIYYKENLGDIILSNMIEDSLKSSYNIIKIDTKFKLYLFFFNLKKIKKIFFLGGIFQDKSSFLSFLYYVSIILICNLLKIKVITISTSVEEFKYPVSKFIFKKLRINFCWSRDKYSYNHLKKISKIIILKEDPLHIKLKRKVNIYTLKKNLTYIGDKQNIITNKKNELISKTNNISKINCMNIYFAINFNEKNLITTLKEILNNLLSLTSIKCNINVNLIFTDKKEFLNRKKILMTIKNLFIKEQNFYYKNKIEKDSKSKQLNFTVIKITNISEFEDFIKNFEVIKELPHNNVLISSRLHLNILFLPYFYKFKKIYIFGEKTINYLNTFILSEDKLR